MDLSKQERYLLSRLLSNHYMEVDLGRAGLSENNFTLSSAKRRLYRELGQISALQNKLVAEDELQELYQTIEEDYA